MLDYRGSSVRSIYNWLTHLFLAGVVVQIFLAGYGVFASAEGATEHKFVDNFLPHAAVGWLLGLLGLILRWALACQTR